jgi:hypothetical protein
LGFAKWILIFKKDWGVVLNTKVDSSARKLAIKKTLLQLLGPLVCVVTCGFIALAYLFAPDLFIYVIGWSIAACIIVLIILKIILVYQENLEEITGFVKPSAWKKNFGAPPTCEKVNVIHEDGLACWNIDPSEKIWAKDVENPIKEYMECVNSENRRIKIDK